MSQSGTALALICGFEHRCGKSCWIQCTDSMLRYAVLSVVLATAAAGARDAWQASLQANKRDRPPPRSPIWDKSFRCVVNGKNASNNAYAVVLGPISEERKYSKWVYPILALKAALHKRGSRADVLALLALEEDKEKHRMLPQEEAMLRKAGVRYRYVPKPRIRGFHMARLSVRRRAFKMPTLTPSTRLVHAGTLQAVGLAAHGVPPHTSARRGRLASY